MKAKRIAAGTNALHHPHIGAWFSGFQRLLRQSRLAQAAAALGRTVLSSQGAFPATP